MAGEMIFTQRCVVLTDTAGCYLSPLSHPIQLEAQGFWADVTGRSLHPPSKAKETSSSSFSNTAVSWEFWR